jgi:hypothetical protein
LFIFTKKYLSQFYMKKLFTLLALAAFLTSCGSSGSSTSSDSTSTDTSATASAKEAGTDNSSKWSYKEKEDKMTSTKTHYASISSDNELEFEFPYNGGSNGTITLRKGAEELSVILGISKGQFNTGVESTPIKVRFDDGKVLTYDCSESSDGSSDILFIPSEKKFIAKLKKSKKMIIQAEFYDAGLKEMEFTTAGLKWD